MANKLFNQHGEKIPRFGKAGVQRTLMAPVKISDADKKPSYAMVRCDVTDVYIVRYGEGQRSCTFTVSWWGDRTDGEAETREFQFAQRDKAINLFLKKCKELA